MWPLWLLFAAAAGLLIAAAAAWRLRPRQQRRHSRSDACADPQCVRCNPARLGDDFGRNRARLCRLLRCADPEVRGAERVAELRLASDPAAESPALPQQRPTVVWVPRLSAAPGGWMLPPAALRAAGAAEAAALWAELSAALDGELGAVQLRFAGFDPSVHSGGAGDWSAVYLVKDGAAAPALRLLPRAERFLRAAGQMRGCLFGAAYYSRLAPGARVAPHCGPTNARTRCHLPLRVPPGSSGGLTVCGTQRSWVEGEVMAFDDSMHHSAEYSATGSEARVVLIFDLWHEGLSEAERAALRVLFPAPR